MNKRKAIAVTVIMAVMLAVIVWGLWRLNHTAFFILTGALAAYGFLCGAASCGRWLMQEAPMLPPAAQTERRTVRGRSVQRMH